MASRHLARSVAMQALYEWDFRDSADLGIDKIVNRVMDEFAPGLEDRDFVFNLVHKVVEKRTEIDTIIEKAAPEWPISQIAIVDRNVLRIGLWELLYGDYKEVPPKVAINEAIELAKTFGGENSGRFINGVLGTVYREIGEPGKDDTAKKSLSEEEFKALPIEKRGGALVFNNKKIALVHDVFGYWTLPKGRILEGETDKEGALRAVQEELGIKKLELGRVLAENEYVANDPERGPVRRKVIYYFGETSDTELHLKITGGLDDARWFLGDELNSLRMYDDIKAIFNRNRNLL